MNRAQRRRAEAIRRRLLGSDDPVITPIDTITICGVKSRADALRLAARLAEADPTVSGATVITGEDVIYLDAERLQRGGTA
jgi:hypothetical protein